MIFATPPEAGDVTMRRWTDQVPGALWLAKARMTFDLWLEFGQRNGWCSDEFCLTHEGYPMTSEEEDEWAEGCDPCAHMVRLGFPPMP
jgi:hypothetical protein